MVLQSLAGLVLLGVSSNLVMLCCHIREVFSVAIVLQTLNPSPWKSNSWKKGLVMVMAYALAELVVPGIWVFMREKDELQCRCIRCYF